MVGEVESAGTTWVRGAISSENAGTTASGGLFSAMDARAIARTVPRYAPNANTAWASTGGGGKGSVV